MYGLKYSIPFTSYEIRISQKDYAGSVTTLEAAGTPAAVHSWDRDEPTAPIKGSSLTANIIGVPLLSFYATNDDQYKGELYKGNTLLFSGFLVQDDCIEDIDDLAHSVSLSFTDNLGLLKDVSLDAALGVTASKITLFQIIQACITATGITLPLDIYASLKEDSHSTASPFFAQTLIAKESFIKNEREYDNCYNVLNKIMFAFNATIMQANGKWNIIRWFEASPVLFSYSDTFTLLSTGSYSNSTTFGKGQSLVPEFGYNKRIVRPYKEVKTTFNYKPQRLLVNTDLKDVGPLIGATTLNGVTYTDYALNYGFTEHVYSANATTIPIPFIRVETDAIYQVEKDRYIVQPDPGNSVYSFDIVLESKGFEVNQGDRIDMSFEFRSKLNFNSVEGVVFCIKLVSGSTTYYLSRENQGLHVPLHWIKTTQRNMVIFPGAVRENYQDKTKWSVLLLSELSDKIDELPADGIMYIGYGFTTGIADNAYYAKGFKLSYYTYINNTTRIEGQTHTNKQAINTKNTEDKDVNIDDSPKNNISGTLFINGLTGDLQTRTATWNGGKKLGAITTQEVKQWRSKARTICEGSLYGNPVVSPMNTFTNPAFPNLNFIPGTMQINYANESVSGTLHEITQAGEGVVNDYKFDYIYNTK